MEDTRGPYAEVIYRCPLPLAPGEVPAGARARCTLGEPSWTAETVPLSVEGQLALVAVTGSLPAVFQLLGPNGETLRQFTGPPLTFAKVIAVWAPEPVTCQVEVLAASGDCRLEGEEISCPVGLCLVVDCPAPYYLAWWTKS